MFEKKNSDIFLTNLKDKIIGFIWKHYIKLAFIMYWLFLSLLSGFFLYISIQATTYENFYSYLIFSIIIFILGFIGHRFFYNSINEKNPLLNLMTTILLVIVTLSGLITYLIMLIFTVLIVKLPNFKFIGDEGDWINFIGIIIAGLITMLGITITINYQQKVRDEDLKNQLLPLLEITLTCFSEKTQKPLRKFHLQSPWSLNIQNIGDNPIRNLKVDKLDAYFFNNETDTDALMIPIHFENFESLKTNLISMNKIHEVEIQLPPTLLPKVYYKYLRLYFHFEYYDLTLKNLHKHKTFVNFELSVSEPRFSTTGYKDWTLISIHNQFID